MTQISKGPLSQISRDFVPKPFQADKEDCYYFRNQQNTGRNYRSLTSEEIEILVKNNNTAEVWDKILVSEHFNPSLVRNCDFWGMVRLGDLTPAFLEFHQLRLPVGLYNCSIISCDIGDNVAMRNVHHLSHYIIGNHVILFNIQEMLTVNQGKFGNGIVKKGESEEVRIWLEIANENGGRSVLPFEGMLPADAALWARFRDNEDLLHALKTMTDARGDTRRGYYGTVGDNSVIKNSRIIKDVMIGAHCYIKGANKLKNLTIQSSAEEPSQVGEGVELVNGIIGFNNRIFYGVKAVRFVTCRNVQLKYGARLINSFLGPNSTVSCCEILNNLVYGFHEQHHNNSFLIAATIEGQSNIAAGATIGSNHNSRANDGEIIAKRGFWPGLESNFKHNCNFASFTLIAKGSYQKEMYIPLPFSLVATTDKANTIQVLPAYWFKHNMYALERNAWKFDKRDKRHHKEQPIETDYLAPDTAEEILGAMQLLEDKISGHLGHPVEKTDLLENLPVQSTSSLEITEFVKKGIVVVRKPLQAYRLYHLMLDYYGCKQLYNALVAVLRQQSGAGALEELKRRFKSQPQEWFNLELYQMAEPTAALGIYLAKCGSETPAPSIKARNTLNRYQLTAVKGCCFIQINNSSGDTTMQKPMIALMNHLLDQIEPAKDLALLEAIASKHLVPGSIRLIRGPYALQPIYTFGEGDILQLEGIYYGIVADYQSHYSDFSQITIPYGKEDKAASVLKNLKANLDAYLNIINTWPDGFAFKDYRQRYGTAQRIADTLVLRIDLTALPSHFKPE